MSSDEVELGYISGVFGVKGELRLHVHNRESTYFSRPRKVTLVSPDGQRVAVELGARTGAGKRVIGRVAQVTNPDEARELVGWTIVVPPEALPKPAADEFYLHQVCGLPVFVGDEQVGTVVDVHSGGPVDLFEVAVDGDVQFVPALKEFVLSVSPQEGRVVLSEKALDT